MGFHDYIKFQRNVALSACKRLSPAMFVTIILEYIFFALVFLFTKVWLSKLTVRYNIADVSADAPLEKLFVEASTFYYYMVISVAVLLAAIILLSAVIRPFMWLLITRQKPAAKNILRFMLSKLLLNAIFTLVIVLLFIAIQFEGAKVVAGILSVLAIYLFSIIHPMLAKKPEFASIKRGIVMGFAKMHYIIVPYMILAAVGVVISRFRPLSENILIPIIFNAVLLLYFALCRYYAASMVFELDRKR
ncbi:hypothetical protein HYU10_00550 [Candidatus Woesearchaeota archaeon]|nr:hypothetical protein [Candidatus Woesearchaeota archaeon]